MPEVTREQIDKWNYEQCLLVYGTLEMIRGTTDHTSPHIEGYIPYGLYTYLGCWIAGMAAARYMDTLTECTS